MTLIEWINIPLLLVNSIILWRNGVLIRRNKTLFAQLEASQHRILFLTRHVYRPDHNGECLNCDEPFNAHTTAPPHFCPSDISPRSASTP